MNALSVHQPLTAGGWSGLPIVAIQHCERVRYAGYHLPAPLLVLWLSGGTEVNVHRTSGRHSSFRAAAGRFDLWSDGEYASILADGVPSRKLLVELNPAVISRLQRPGDEPGPVPGCRFQFADPLLRRLLRRLLAHAVDGEPLGSLYTEWLSAAIVDRLSLPCAADRRERCAELSAVARRRLVDLIENRLGAPPSIGDMALAAGLRTSDFSKAFRGSFGASPHQYLLARRVERAKQMLALGRSMTSIAFELGFASHAHFSDTFRARTGATPSGYRGSQAPRLTAAAPFDVSERSSCRHAPC